MKPAVVNRFRMAAERVVDALICGDEPAALRFLETVLEAEGYRVETFSQLTEAVVRCLRRRYRMVIISLSHLAWTQADKQIETMRIIREIDPDLPQVLICSEGTLELERRIRGEGIFYLLTAPLSTSELKAVVDCAISKGRRELKP